MSLGKDFFNRETNITAKVICDSVSPSGVRMTTFEIEFPRFVHCELMTHRSLSKNSSSSRAIPIKKMLDQIESNMAMPVYWGKAKSGMQATEEVCLTTQRYALECWQYAYLDAKQQIEKLVDGNLHKQIPNRLSEPFQMMKVVISGTDWENFFNLRIHPDSQPEICMLAYKMYKAMQESEPVELKEGEWHLPYVSIGLGNSYGLLDKDGCCQVALTLEDAIKYSAACCASVSYRTEGMTLDKAEKIFDMLVKAEVIHASPFEHLATPIRNQSKNINGWDEGITHMNRNGDLCSGNLRGWVSYRHLLPNNTNWKFDFEDRMKMFD